MALMSRSGAKSGPVKRGVKWVKRTTISKMKPNKTISKRDNEKKGPDLGQKTRNGPNVP